MDAGDGEIHDGFFVLTPFIQPRKKTGRDLLSRRHARRAHIHVCVCVRLSTYLFLRAARDWFSVMDHGAASIPHRIIIRGGLCNSSTKFNVEFEFSGLLTPIIVAGKATGPLIASFACDSLEPRRKRARR